MTDDGHLIALRQTIKACDVLLDGGCGTYLVGGEAIARHIYGVQSLREFESFPRRGSIDTALKSALLDIQRAARDTMRRDYPREAE
jgi:hypothetical protein